MIIVPCRSVDVVRENGNAAETSGLRLTGEWEQSKGEWQAPNRGVTSRVSSALERGRRNIDFIRTGNMRTRILRLCVCSKRSAWKQKKKKTRKNNTKKTYPVDTRRLRRANTCFFYVVIMLFIYYSVLVSPTVHRHRKPEASSTTGETSCNCGRRRHRRRRSVCRTKTKSETDRPGMTGTRLWGGEGEWENNAVRNARKTMVRKILDVLANASSTRHSDDNRNDSRTKRLPRGFRCPRQRPLWP